MQRKPLVGCWLAALAALLSACQGADPTAAVLPASDTEIPPPREFCAAQPPGRIVQADPASYRALLASLRPGDTLSLAGGEYARLKIANLRGAPGRCITVTGPAGHRRAVILGEIGRKTVEIVDSSYIVVSNLVIDSRGIPGADGIKAPLVTPGATHHIVLDGNLIIGAGATQQTDGISSKTPTWNWLIRRNTIIDAGTAIYLGDSDGTAPFVAGLIEGNLVVDPLGYDMQIKYQTARPALSGMPQAAQSTIIRNNVFKKDGRPSPDGDRPNLLVGGFPESGPGSRDLYQIYGNLLVGNPREALFQGSGRICFFDNVLIGGHNAAAVFRDHDLPLKLARVFGNTIYTPDIGIKFDSPARQGYVVFGNVIFSKTPVAGVDNGGSGNFAATQSAAPAP